MKLLYWLASDKGEAESIASRLLERKLIACANIMAPCKSLYEWEGVLESSEEVPVFCKASDGNAAAAVSAIIEMHSYDCPAVMVLPVEAAPDAFEAWVAGQCA